MIVIVLVVIHPSGQIADAPLVVFGADKDAAMAELLKPGLPFESEAERAELVEVVRDLRPEDRSALHRLGIGNRAAKIYQRSELKPPFTSLGLS